MKQRNFSTCVFFALLLTFVVYLPVLAQDLPPDQIPDVPGLLASIGLAGQAKILGIVVFVCQAAMWALRKFLPAAQAKLRFAAVWGLALAVGVLGLMKGGLSFGSAIMHANTLAAVQVFAHQFYSVYIEKKPA